MLLSGRVRALFVENEANMSTDIPRLSQPALDMIARKFVSEAVIGYGSEAAQVQAVQAVLDAAGFDATATCAPVFGAIWPRPCAGTEADAASAWLDQITSTMDRGDFHNEVIHVADCISHRSTGV